MPFYDKGVIHIPKPQTWLVGGTIYGFGFKLFHEHVAKMGLIGEITAV